MNILTGLLSLILAVSQAYAPGDFVQVSGATLQARWAAARDEGRSASADSFWVAYSFTVRPDVHVTAMDGNLSVSSYRTSDGIEWIPSSTEKQQLGIFMMVRRSDGGIDKVRLIDMSQNFKVHDRKVFWLGTPSSVDSVSLLAGLAADTPQNASSSLLHAMTLHDGGQAAQKLLQLAKAPNSTEVRKNAMMLLGQEVSRQAGEELASMVNDPNTDIQKQAVAAISRRPNDESIPALIDIAKTHPSAAVRKDAIFWLGQKQDARVIAFFEQLLKK